MTARHDWPEFSTSLFRRILNGDLLGGLQKTVGFRNLNGPPPIAKPIGEGGGLRPPLAPVGFAVREGGV
jgi:hypothetical protein